MTSKIQTSTIGDIFRNAREKKKKTLADASKELCIQQSYLRSLEENDDSNLPEEVFVLGYVRSYASYLKLDAEDILLRFKFEKKDKLHPSELHFPESDHTKKLPPKTIIIGFSVAAAILIFGFGLSSYFQEPKSTTVEIEAFLETEIEPQTDANVTSAAPAEEHSANITSTEDQETTQEANIVTNVPAEGIVIRAIEDSWLQIETKDGGIIISKILRTGEIYEVPELKKAIMDTGNAGGLEIIIDGKSLGPAGDVGQVKRDISLDEKTLRALSTS